MTTLERTDPSRARAFFEEKLSFTTGPVELAAAMRTMGDALCVIDVRAQKDFDEAHIPGSINVPESAWGEKAGENAGGSFERLSRDRLNVVLCYSEVCHLGARAAVELAKAGFPVMELSGGFAAWRSQALPTERSSTADLEAVDRTRALMAEQRAAVAALESERASAASAEAEAEPTEEVRPKAAANQAEAEEAKADAGEPEETGAEEAKADAGEPEETGAEEAKADAGEPKEAEPTEEARPKAAANQAEAEEAKAEAGEPEETGAEEAKTEANEAEDAARVARTAPVKEDASDAEIVAEPHEVSAEEARAEKDAPVDSAEAETLRELRGLEDGEVGGVAASGPRRTDAADEETPVPVPGAPVRIPGEDPNGIAASSSSPSAKVDPAKPAQEAPQSRRSRSGARAPSSPHPPSSR